MKKHKIMWCTDSPCVNTGFGRVSMELITRLLKTGKYEFHVMGTNDVGDPHPLRGMKDLYIYPLTNLMEDPYGQQRFPHLLREVDPDLIFALNDIWVWTGDEKRQNMDHWMFKDIKNFKPFIPWVGYFAVDGRPWEQRWVDSANHMTRAVVFSDYAMKVLKETPGVNLDTVRLVYHGAAIDQFFPLPKDEISKFRKEAWGIESDDLFVVGCVARNQPRKNIPRLIQVFKCFSDGYGICATCGHPKSLDVAPDCEICGDTECSETNPGVGKMNTVLYLHMNMLDMRGFRLPKIANDNKLQNLIAPRSHNVAAGVPADELNRIYNAMDIMVLPTYAGGYELPVVEAQAAGTPVIATRTTCVTEHLDEGKGFPVLPETFIVLDDANHCLKHPISFKGLLDALNETYYDKKKRESVIPKALAYARERNWDVAAEGFDKVFEEALQERVDVNSQFSEDEELRKILIINKTPDPANLLSMTPTFREIKKKHDPCELILACSKSTQNIIENNKNLDKIIDADKLWFDGELKNANVQDVTHAIPQFVNNAARFTNLTWEKFWLNTFKLDDADTSKMDLFLNKSDIKFAKSKLGKKTDKKRIAICLDYNNPTLSLNYTKWAELLELMSKFNEVDTVAMNVGSDVPKIDNIKYVSGAAPREMAACLKTCDLIVTLDNAFVMIGKTLNKKMIIIQGPRDTRYKLSDYENYSIISMEEFFKNSHGCLPCWIGPNDKCSVTNSPNAACMANINSTEIFGKILTELNSIEEKKESVAIA